MPSLAQTVTTTTTTQVKIAPAIKRKLMTELRAYADLKTKRDALDAAMKKSRSKVEDCLGDIGESSLTVDGFRTTLVAPVRTTLSEEKLIAQGVTVDQIAAAKVQTPTKAYVKITCPGEKDE
jgi:hypothetical protein